MGWFFFLVSLLLGAIIFAALRLMGVRAEFEPVFKVCAIFFAMLPIVVVSGVMLFALEVGVAMIVLGTLQTIGVLGDIPHQYEVYGLIGLLAPAIGIAGFVVLRYALLVRNQ